MLCQRTLRCQVKTMQFTKRIVKTILIIPYQEEVVLSTKISAYFHRDYCLHFLRLRKSIFSYLLKLLASSLSAFISGFDKTKKGLQGVVEGREELAERNSITEYAENITQSSRSKAFIEIVCKALIELRSNNSEERIIVFSENTVTLQYFIYVA